MAIDKDQVSRVLDLIRPALQADGGDVQLVDVDEEGVVTVQLHGACNGCPMSQMTLANGVERILKEHIPGITKVVSAEQRARAIDVALGSGDALQVQAAARVSNLRRCAFFRIAFA